MSDVESLIKSAKNQFDIDLLKEIQDELFGENGVSRKLSEANVSNILKLIPKLSEDEKYGWEFSQIDPYYQPKSICGSNDIDLNDIDITNLDPDCTSQSKILIIYTGGTIGMRLKNDGYQPQSNYFCKALRKLPMFHDSNIKSDIFSKYCNAFIMPRSREGRRVLYVVLEYDPILDSSDITVDDYIHIARDIKSEYEKYDGFIILHGTDTLAYTASSLSFILENLGKPVILTGSQIPVFELRSDGRENLLTSLLLASHYYIPEVTVFFHEKLIRANRCSKMSSVHFDAFDSPNYPPLATIGVEIVVNSQFIREPPDENSTFNIQTVLCTEVSVLRMFPSITYQTVVALLNPPIQGVVLQTYGSGNVPICREDILRCLKEASDKGVIIINISQCNRGGVKNIYKSGTILEKYGVISGIDMTPEAALSKLSYVLGKSEWNLQEKRQVMSRNLRGEISLNLSINCSMKNKRPIQDISIMSKKVVMMAMCSSAKSGDISTLVKIAKHYNKWDCSNENGRTPLHIAAESNQLNVIKFLVSKNVININILDKNGRTPLFYALINKSETGLIQFLIDNGASVSYINDADKILFNYIINSELEILKRFHFAKFDFNIINQELNTPLHLAVIHNHYNIVKWLVESVFININMKNEIGHTALEEAEMRQYSKIVEYLKNRNELNVIQ